ncbi:MAG TPA: MerR family transcriptional regulator [Nocardioidaceae bacterium]|nr:MerR family transcriptional regulator [Nocardioidaceae bacterium]
MFSIGDFASHGRVSVRMLRHYDAIGLLPPARVDPATGYRAYDASQLSRLNRIVALKDLGFMLEQVRSILDDKVSADELRGMLRLREADLQSRLAADTARLHQVEARLRLIEEEGAMPTDDVQIKRIPGVRVAELTATADGFEPEAIGPVIQPLYDQLMKALERAHVTPTGPAVAYYEDASDGDRVVVHAAIPVNAVASDTYDFAIVDLPPIEQAATIVHRGPMDGVMSTIQTLARWIDANDYRSVGYNRELYLDYGMSDDSSGWTTELQEPVVGP